MKPPVAVARRLLSIVPDVPAEGDSVRRMTELRDRKKEYTAPVREADAPVSRAMLFEVRDELKSDIRGLRRRFDKVDAQFVEVHAKFDRVDAQFVEVHAKFDRVDAQFAEVHAKFDQVDARFDQVDAKFDQLLARMDMGFQLLRAEIHATRLLVETQEAKNTYVLDALNIWNAKQVDLENRQLQLERDWANYERANKNEL